jgi:AcrR family transcriptional regulator
MVYPMSDPVKGRRAYDSTRRRQQARQTQLDVLHAAHDLFVAQGYGRTTMTDIARAAEVSVETVYAAFGTKAALLHRVWDITIGGDDEDVVYHERPEVRALRAEPDLAVRLRGHAVLYTATSRRIVPFMLAIQGAASAEPSAADLLAEIGRQRYEGMGVMAREAAATGQLAVSEDECHDLMWSLTDGALWHRLVIERGWSDERFAGWLGETWVRLLVRPTG